MFPLARPDVCGKWVAAMRRNNFKPSKYSNICSQHFSSDAFKRECNNRVLKENAVPSLFTLSNVHLASDEDFTDAPESPPLLTLTPLPLTPLPLTGAPVSGVSDPAAMISCDHNYTAEDSARQRRRAERLEQQLARLRRRLRAAQQRIRRQETQLRKMRELCTVSASAGKVTFGEGCVILLPHKDG
ncbi:THAP domain-containing protein 1 isoform X2 [Cololabis saira]|uniref:THAP domain-containing protein 1 isoform X2 n=1 Tax=Cololabis saira TaxID=129043 RepID=UPI002AD27DC2|nr:THAP domain-containing protein 1 isoform X2 [Cololabis saira]XP_061589597.1 THAP domain-containing protein 1 isoform X2 [Cololabis saira]